MIPYLPTRILAIDPTSRGFAYAVLEGTERLVDWGLVQIGRGATTAPGRLESLLERYKPDLLVTGEYLLEPRRGRTMRPLLEDAEALAWGRGIPTGRISRTAIALAFEGVGKTKHARAVAIVEHFPELLPRLPAPRKPWMSEDERMNIFDAIALALAASLKPSP